MLDLILTWGTLDGALTQLLAAFTGEELHEAAERIGKNKGGMKLLEIARTLEAQPELSEAARSFRKQKKRYEKHSKCRDRIAHGHCAGYLRSDDQIIVFAVAEHVGGSHLAIEAIPLENIHEAIRFGQALTTLSIELKNRIHAARERLGDGRNST